MSEKDLSGQNKEILVHDVETGTLKRIKNPDKDGSKVRSAVPPTHELKQNTKPRTAPR